MREETGTSYLPSTLAIFNMAGGVNVNAAPLLPKATYLCHLFA